MMDWMGGRGFFFWLITGAVMDGFLGFSSSFLGNVAWNKPHHDITRFYDVVNCLFAIFFPMIFSGLSITITHFVLLPNIFDKSLSLLHKALHIAGGVFSLSLQSLWLS